MATTLAPSSSSSSSSSSSRISAAFSNLKKKISSSKDKAITKLTQADEAHVVDSRKQQLQQKFSTIEAHLANHQVQHESKIAIDDATLEQLCKENENHAAVDQLMNSLLNLNQAIINRGQRPKDQQFANEAEIINPAKAALSHYFDLAKHMIQEQANQAYNNRAEIAATFQTKVAHVLEDLNHATNGVNATTPEDYKKHGEKLKAAVEKRRAFIEGHPLSRDENKHWNLGLNASLALAGALLLISISLVTTLMTVAGVGLVGYGLYSAYNAATKTTTPEEKASKAAGDVIASMYTAPTLSVK